jgi:conjugative relaxase-like TrwC/TraI family protein
MLSTWKMSGSARGEYFLDLTDYYGNERAEPPGKWWGRGAKWLGLEGEVKRRDLRNLLSRYDQHGNPLTQSAGKDGGTSGWDHVFSAPKSVSNLWAGAPAIRPWVEKYHDEAVNQALSFIEDEAACTRRGKGGKEFIKAKLVVAKFQHSSSRNLDELLHTHCLVLVPVVGEDGRTSALDSRALYRMKMAAGAIYRAHLSYCLEARLGLELIRKKSWFEVKGVPESLLKATSTRREEVLEATAAYGGEFASGRAKDVAAVATRSEKRHVLRSELFPAWEKRAASHGLTPEYAASLLGKAPRRNQLDELEGAINRAVTRITQNASHFSEAELVRFTAEEAQGRGLDAGLIRDGVKYHLANKNKTVTLGRTDRETRYTTPEMLKLEKQMLEAAQRLSKKNTFEVSRENVEEAIRRVEKDSGVRFTNEQRIAVNHVLRGEGNVSLVEGLAGTGKTTLLRTVKVALELEGKTVLGTAIAGKAVRGLSEGSGIKSYTVAKLVGVPEFDYVGDFDRGVTDDAAHHVRQLTKAALGKGTTPLERVELDSNSVLVIDEAGMIGSKHIERLIREAERTGAKIIAVGDSAQLQPVAEAGGPFASLAKRLGSARLTQIVRQRLDAGDPDPAWKRKAVARLSEGEARDALRSYAERGYLSVADSREEAVRSLLVEWARAGGAENPKDHAIFVGTNEERRTINALAQKLRAERGELSPIGVKLQEHTAYVGDRVTFRRRSKLLGVENRDLGTLVSVDFEKRWAVVRLDRGETVKVYFKHYGHENLTLAYAHTTHAGQGQTCENAYLLTGGQMTDLHSAYVQGSRARGTTRWFTDVNEAGDDLTDLARQMSRSRQKDLAHDILERIDARIPHEREKALENERELELG